MEGAGRGRISRAEVVDALGGGKRRWMITLKPTKAAGGTSGKGIESATVLAALRAAFGPAAPPLTSARRGGPADGRTGTEERTSAGRTKERGLTTRKRATVSELRRMDRRRRMG